MMFNIFVIGRRTSATKWLRLDVGRLEVDDADNLLTKQKITLAGYTDTTEIKFPIPDSHRQFLVMFLYVSLDFNFSFVSF